MPVRNLRGVPFFRRPIGLWNLLLALTMLLGILLGKFSRWRPIGFAPLIMLVLLVAAVGDGCGITGSNSSVVPPPGTSAGVYPIVITATGSGNVTATTTLNLTVN